MNDDDISFFKVVLIYILVIFLALIASMAYRYKLDHDLELVKLAYDCPKGELHADPR